MFKRLAWIAFMGGLFIALLTARAQDVPPKQKGMAQEPGSDALAASEFGEGLVSCVAMVKKLGAGGSLPKPKIRISGRQSGNAVSDIAWSVEEAKGAWSFSGSASKDLQKTRRFNWSGSFWFKWLSLFPTQASSLEGNCNY